jgi:hypothetical protein
MNRPSALLTAAVVIAASLLAACSERRIATSRGDTTAPPKNGDRSEIRTDGATIGKRFASAALDDRRLGEIRGGFDTGQGVVVNFSFQEATYVNHNLAQSIVVPTMTISPSTGVTSVAGTSQAPPAVISNSTTQVRANAAALAGQALVNSGVTSIVSRLGGGGITNTISNTANNQLVQQVITANIGIAGLSQSIQQSVAAVVTSRVAAANSQFR